MSLVIILSVIGALGYESLGEEDALQRLREGNFDVILDIRSIEDFESLRLAGAFHLGSLKHRGRHHHARESESSSSSESSEEEPVDARFLGRHDIPKASGERTGRCKPECALGRSPPHGHHGHHGRHGHHGHGRPEGEYNHEHDAEPMGSYHMRHRARHHDSSEDSSSVATSFVKYFGITFGAFVILSILICLYKKCIVKEDVVVVAEQPRIQEGSQIEGSGFAVAINDPETGSPIETINGSPEGWGEHTNNTNLPPTFEEVAKASLNNQYHTLAE